MGEEANADSDTLHICNEGAGPRGCLAERGGNHAFNVSLVGETNRRETINISNEASSHRSFLQAGVSLRLQEARLNNLTLKSDGSAGDVITIAGQIAAQAYSAGDSSNPETGTLFELDLDPAAGGGKGQADSLVFEGGATSIAGGSPTATISIVTAPRIANAGSVVTVASVHASSSIEGITILEETSEQSANPADNSPMTIRRATLNRQAWTINFIPDPAPQATGSILRLAAGAAPVANAATWADAVSAASSVFGQFSGAALPDISQEVEAGVSQEGALERAPIVWTSLKAGSEEQTLSDARNERYKRYESSFQLFSGGIVFVGDGAETRVSHSVSLTYGAIDSGKGVSTSVTGFGYGAHFAMAEGAHLGLSGTMVNSSSEKTAGEFDVGGQVLSAEGGKTSQVRDGLDMTLMGGLTVDSAGDVKLKSGDSLSGYFRTTARFGARLDREQAADEVSQSSSSLFGAVMVAHDLSSGFDFQRPGEAPVSIDTAKTWLNLSGGMAWQSGSGRFYFEGSVEQSVAGASASRRSVTAGYDLKW